MQALDLNLASRPFKNNTLLWAGYGLAAALGVFFTFWNVTTYVEHTALLGRMEERLNTVATEFEELAQRLVQARRAMGRREHNLAALTAQAAKANEVIAWKAFSWTRLFNRLEVIQPWNVQMISVRPIFRSRRGDRSRLGAASRQSIPVAVEGQAQSLRAFLEFQRQLLADDYFERPEPERYEQLNDGQILFSMRFTYFPDGVDRPDDGAAEVAEAADTVDGTPAVDPEAPVAKQPAVATDDAAPGDAPDEPAPAIEADAEGEKVADQNPVEPPVEEGR